MKENGQVSFEWSFVLAVFFMSHHKRRILSRGFKLLRVAQISSIAALFSFGKHLLSHFVSFILLLQQGFSFHHPILFPFDDCSVCFQRWCVATISALPPSPLEKASH